MSFPPTLALLYADGTGRFNDTEGTSGDGNVKKTIYLANAYGFSRQQREALLPTIVAELEKLGLEVWEPF